MGVHYTKSEDQYLIENYQTMTSNQLAKGLNREVKAVENHLNLLRKKGLIVRKEHYAGVSSIDILRLEAAGISNNKVIATIRKKVQVGLILNLVIDGRKEQCPVIFKSFLNFTVQRKNYKESFNYDDVKQGTVKILRA